ALSETLREDGADLICCAGFMRVLGPTFVAAHAGRILNIHPSLLPLFPGLDTHMRALEAGVAIHGCTVHEVTPELDGGPILGQAAVPVLNNDTAESLAQRVLRQEHRLYPAVLQAICAGKPLKDAPLALLADA
ncbi:MAG: phosphoribosylglycinamide formyltransferase, partial [Pseudomonadota bacterium]